MTGRGPCTPSTRSRLMPTTGSLVFLHLLTTHPPSQCHTKATWLSPLIDTAPCLCKTGIRYTQNQENPQGQRTSTCSLQESPSTRLDNPNMDLHQGTVLNLWHSNCAFDNSFFPHTINTHLGTHRPKKTKRFCSLN